MMYFIFGALIISGIVYFSCFSKKRKSENEIKASYECSSCDEKNCDCEKIHEKD